MASRYYAGQRRSAALLALDGKSIKTIESLKRADGTLHRWQALVGCHGSVQLLHAGLCDEHHRAAAGPA